MRKGWTLFCTAVLFLYKEMMGGAWVQILIYCIQDDRMLFDTDWNVVYIEMIESRGQAYKSKRWNRTRPIL